jgi:hypothetical protein
MFSIGTVREGVRKEDLRGQGERYKTLEKCEKRGKKLEPWPKTGSAGDTSWKPYDPEGVKGNK